MGVGLSVIAGWRSLFMAIALSTTSLLISVLGPAEGSLPYLMQSSDLSYFLERQRAEPLLGILTMESSLPQRVRLQGVSHGQMSPLFFCSCAATQNGSVLFNRHRLGQFHFTSEKRSATQIPGGNYRYVQLCSCFINHYLIHLCSFVLPESNCYTQ